MRKLVLITGASAGIGAEFARQYATKGWDVALTARREERLHGIANEIKQKHGAEVIVIAQDLADPDAPEFILRAVERAGRHIDGLCLLYTSPSPRDATLSRMPSSA